MKQTAVEWLFEQMIKCELLPKSSHPDNVLFYKAKEMEKQQIVDSFEAAEKDCGKDFLHGDLYYHETFKSE